MALVVCRSQVRINKAKVTFFSILRTFPLRTDDSAAGSLRRMAIVTTDDWFHCYRGGGVGSFSFFFIFLPVLLKKRPRLLDDFIHVHLWWKSLPSFGPLKKKKLLTVTIITIFAWSISSLNPMNLLFFPPPENVVNGLDIVVAEMFMLMTLTVTGFGRGGAESYVYKK